MKKKEKNKIHPEELRIGKISGQILDSYVDENGIRVIKKFKLNSVSF